MHSSVAKCVCISGCWDTGPHRDSASGLHWEAWDGSAPQPPRANLPLNPDYATGQQTTSSFQIRRHMVINQIVNMKICIQEEEEEKEEDIHLAQTVKRTNDNIKHKFQEPGCQKPPRSTMLATQTHTISCSS